MTDEEFNRHLDSLVRGWCPNLEGQDLEESKERFVEYLRLLLRMFERLEREGLNPAALTQGEEDSIIY